MNQLSLVPEPYSYDPNFLTKLEADELFAFCQTFPPVRPTSPFNSSHVLRRVSIGSWNDYGISAAKMRHATNRSEQKNRPTMDSAPLQIKDLAVRLSLLAAKPVNYISVLGYENEHDHIDWHQHAEDRARDARVFIVSLGETRTFGLREICPDCRVCAECNEAACDGHRRKCAECVEAKRHRERCPITNNKANWILLQPAHGSLITLSSDANWTHEHAVLDDTTIKSLRISFNLKCLPTGDSLEDFIARMAQPSSTPVITPPQDVPFALSAEVTSPKIYDCHAGKKYPSDTVYVGREVRDRQTGKLSWPATPFGNQNRRKTDTPEGKAAWLADVAEKMKDPKFRKQVESLRGKDLLCWCRVGEPNCHARIWLELANAPK